MASRLKGNVVAYSCWSLAEDQKDMLMRIFSPAYPDVIAHHVTCEIGSRDSLEVPEPSKIEIIGVADDGVGVQALVVTVNGNTERPNGGIYHITWSIDRAAGRTPKDSNTVISEKGWTPLMLTTPVETQPKVFS